MKITGRKDKYNLGDVVVVYLAGREIKSTVVNVFIYEIDFTPTYYQYVIENDEFGKVSISHYDILGLAETTDNETKDNDGWIMVESEFPNKHKPIFFVTKDSKIIIGYYSYDLGECPTTQVFYDYNSTKKIKPKDVVKWQYVKFPEI